MVEYNRLGRLHIMRRYSEVDEQIRPLIERFRALLMPVHELKAKFVHANTLKELGSDPAQALVAMTDVYREGVRAGNLMLTSSTACGIAQMYGQKELPALADCWAAIGVRLAKRAGSPWVVAYALTTLGELLRDRGEYDAAIKQYRAGAHEYSRARMDPFVAYTRVIVAETLLISGREDEAIAELLLALPIIEAENLVAEAEVSVWLLRQAIRGRGMTPAMLRELRERLDLARQESAR